MHVRSVKSRRRSLSRSLNRCIYNTNTVHQTVFAESRAGHQPPRHPHTDSDSPRARPHQPSEGKQGSSPCPQICGCRRRVEPDAWRHACPVRRRLLRVKPRRFNHENNPQLLSDERVASGTGATWTNSRVFLRAVMFESVRRRSGHRATTPRNPSRGVRGLAPRSTRAAVGSSSAAMRATG